MRTRLQLIQGYNEGTLTDEERVIMLTSFPLLVLAANKARAEKEAPAVKRKERGSRK